MKKNFLGKGISFPYSISEKKGISLSSESENIKESIRIILGTVRGERLMNPDFGCDLNKLVFHPNSPNTAALAKYYVSESVRKWEPRVENITVDVRPDPMKENVLSVKIIYNIIRTNSMDNMVYPFYLRREQDL